MKSIVKSAKTKIILLIVVSSFLIICFIYTRYRIYKSINVVYDNVTIEYGSKNFDIKKLVKKVNGEIISVKKDIDTSLLGDQEIILKVKKMNVIKEIPLKVTIIDTTSPVIKLKSEKITFYEGDKIDLLSNVDSVIDEIDGEIAFSDNTTLENNNYYNLVYEEDINKIGSHEITVSAYDRFGNVSNKKFILEIVKPNMEVEAVSNVNKRVINSFSNDVVSIAKSLIGAPYVVGGNGPYGFDCSGFVQYVYSQVGINISRSSSTQLNDGVAVSYEDAKEGDILSWGYKEGVSTHSALYIGNGKMIHATNPKQGVIISDVLSWTNGSGMQVISVRRIN